MVWQLFVDESGDFNDPGDTCVVAGVLVNAPLRGRDATVRAALEAAYPGASYPFHSSAIRFSSGRVHATLIADPRRTTGGAAERELAARARAFFATHAKDDDASALLASIEERREPEHSVLRACDRLLYHHDTALAGQLKTLTTNDTVRMHQVLSGAWEYYGAAGHGGDTFENGGRFR